MPASAAMQVPAAQTMTDDPVDVDARRRGQRGVVGDRAGRLPEPGVGQREAHRDQHRDLDAHGDEALGRGRDRADLDAGLGDVLVVGLAAAAEQEQQQRPQEQGEADRDDHHGDQAGLAAPELAPEEPVLPSAEGRRDHQRDGRRDQQVQAEDGVEEEREKSADGQQLTMGEVGQSGRTEDQ